MEKTSHQKNVKLSVMEEKEEMMLISRRLSREMRQVIQWFSFSEASSADEEAPEY